jgi:hypothetical protein
VCGLQKIILLSSKGDDMDEKIIEYIRQNQDTYTRKAITTQLINSGYQEADIEAAYLQLETEAHQSDSVEVDEPQSQAQPRKQKQETAKVKDEPKTAWDSKALGFFLVVIVVPVVMYLVPILGYLAHINRWNIDPNLSFRITAGVWLSSLALFFVPSLLESRAPQFATGVKYATRTILVVFVALPCVGAVIIVGTCFFSTNCFLFSSVRASTPRPTAVPISTSILPFSEPAHIGDNRGEAAAGVWENWSYEGQAGEVLTVRVNADIPWESNQIVNTDGFDPWLLVWSPDGSQLDENFDYGLYFTDALIENMSLPVDGTYLINIADYVHDSSGAYTLIIESSLHPTATPSSDSTPSNTPTP